MTFIKTIDQAIWNFLVFAYVKNKSADHLHYYSTSWSDWFCFIYCLFIVSRSEIPRLQLCSVAAQPGLCHTSLFGTLKTVFSREEARMQPHMSFGVLDIILVVMVCLGVLSK